MSRHRFVRNADYDDYDYDDYDDYDYEEEWSGSPLSPSSQMYMRNSGGSSHASPVQRTSLLSFVTTRSATGLDQQLAREEEEALAKQQAINEEAQNAPLQGAADEQIVRQCMEHVESVIGDSFAQGEVVAAIRACNYDAEKAISRLLGDDEGEDVEQTRRTPATRNVGVRATPLSSLGRGLSVVSQDNRPNHSRDATVSLSTLLREMPSSNDANVQFNVSFTNDERPNNNTATAPERFKFDTPSPDDEILARRLGGIMKKTDPVTKIVSPPAQAVVLTIGSSESSTGKGPIVKREVKQAPERAALTGSTGASTRTKVVHQHSAAKQRELQGLLCAHREATNVKEHLNMVVIGHVDAGKSTLMGHLLFKLGNVDERIMHRYKRDAQNMGKASFAYAWVLDEHQEERERGVTMDVAVQHFETEHRMLTLLDAPGHRDFVPNMITGAAQADVAVLVINATRGEFESGFEADGQTKEHAILARSLGVTELAVAINKMDTVEWSKERFDEIVTRLTVFLKQTGFRPKNLRFVPVSGMSGDNLVEKTDQCDWYDGPTLIELIDTFKIAKRPVDAPFRFAVSDVYKGMSSGIMVGGKIEAGAVMPGDQLLVMPGNELCQVKTVMREQMPEKFGAAGHNCDISVTNIERNHLRIGTILCDPAHPIPLVRRFRAQIITFRLTIPLTRGQKLELFSHNLNEPCELHRLVSLLDRSTMEVTKKKPRCIGDKCTAVVEISTPHRAVCLETYAKSKPFGRFMLRSGGRTLCAGIVMEVLK